MLPLLMPAVPMPLLLLLLLLRLGWVLGLELGCDTASADSQLPLADSQGPLVPLLLVVPLRPCTCGDEACKNIRGEHS